MSFFKEFKEDFDQAINELMPEEGAEKDGAVVNTLDADADLQAELNKLDDIFGASDKKASESLLADSKKEDKKASKKEETMAEDVKPEAPKAEASMAEESLTFGNGEVDDEVAVITKSMIIHGDVEASGPIEIRGTVNGNVSSNGKIVVTGTLNGNSKSKEFFADNANMTGEIATEGTVKIGLGSVIRGNISASSSVIAGAVKGDIDIHGPIVVDTSAVVMGNIKSKAVQINNGAVIEGFCSQCYSDVSMKDLFGE